MKIKFIIAGIVLVGVSGFVFIKYKKNSTDNILPDSISETAIQPAQIPFPADTSFSLDTISYYDDEIVGPGRGANTFYTYIQSVKIPSPDSEIWSPDNDSRFLWSQLQPTTAGIYDWSDFDSQVNYSIDKRQRFSFGIETVCTSCPVSDGKQEVGNSTMSYPVFVHAGMQQETTKDWLYDGTWIPNWNSEFFLSSWELFVKAVANHIDTSSYRGIAYKNVIYKIDIRGFGNWGEWHTVPWRDSGLTPAATKPVDSSIKRIIDSHLYAFPDYPLILIGAAFTGEISKAMSYYALTAKNNWGLLGWRKDHWGSISDYSRSEAVNNTRLYNGTALKNLIMGRWKTSPVAGEVTNTTSGTIEDGPCAFWDLENQIRLYHVSQFSNSYDPGTACGRANIRSASKAAGYRFVVYSGKVRTDVFAGDSFHVSLNIANTGIAPLYENWDMWLELKNKHAVVWKGKSAFKPKLFLPGRITINDDFILPKSLQSGTYLLQLTIKDPTGYRNPLPLAITGRNEDGSYFLDSVIIKNRIKK